MQTLLHQSVERSADRYPDAAAFRFLKDSCTYAEFAITTDQLAAVLVEQGVKRGDRVGIFCHKSLQSAFAVYGIFKAGAAYVPIDPMLPVARVHHIIQSCGIRHLVTHPPKMADVRQLLNLDCGIETIIGLKDAPEGNYTGVRFLTWTDVYNVPQHYTPDLSISDQDLAYIIFTSGSTGTPKGIMHTHYSGLSYAQRSAALYQLNRDDILGNHSPLHFDMSTLDYLSGPLTGATTVIIPEAYTKLPASLSQLVDDEKLTIWYSVPFALIQLLLRGVLEKRDFTSLRWVLFGGEPFPPGHLKALMSRLPHARFSNVYGPAEVNQCMYYNVPETFTGLENQVPIGHLCDGCEARIVDESDQEIDPGTVGELLIKSPNMMLGYWQAPEQNKACFYNAPNKPETADRYYRTGDLAELSSGGEYIYHGRKDRQVKVRGNRIELDEVEAVFAAMEGVEEAAAYPISSADEGAADPTGMSCSGIEVALIPTQIDTLSARTLRTAAGQHLPAYAVPVNIKFFDRFPRTTSGKIDRKALQENAVIEYQSTSDSSKTEDRI